MRLEGKILLGCLIPLICFLVFAYVGAWLIAPGSYPRTEVYELPISEDSLLKVIDEFKKENPSYNYKNQIDPIEKHRYWYFRYFYYPDKDLKIMTYVRGSSNKNGPTSFGFVRTAQGPDFKKWKDVNESFWWWINKPEKDEFEERILKPIKEKIKN